MTDSGGYATCPFCETLVEIPENTDLDDPDEYAKFYVRCKCGGIFDIRDSRSLSKKVYGVMT